MRNSLLAIFTGYNVTRMVLCLFCDNTLTSETKPEHILLNALGGRMESRCLICSECNVRFGSTIDSALADQVRDLRNMLQFDSGRRQPPPTVYQKTTAGTVVFDPKDRPRLRGKPFTVDRDGDLATVNIRADSPEHFAECIKHIAALLGRSVEELSAAVLAEGSLIKEISLPLPPEPRAMSFGGEGADRSIVKACLELFATVVGNEEVRAPPYGAAREFVVQGDGGCFHQRVVLDSRQPEHFEKLEREYGSRFNLIYVRSDEIGRVTGHFTLYNLLGWQAILAEAGARPNVSVGLVSDPSKPARWSSRIADEINIGSAWMDAPRFDQEELEGRFGRLFAELRAASRGREIQRIAEEEFRRHGVGEAVVAGDEIHKPLFAAIAARVAAAMLRVAHEQAASLDDIRALLGKSL